MGADRFAAVARTAEGEERDRLWSLMTSIWPNFDVYQSAHRAPDPRRGAGAGVVSVAVPIPLTLDEALTPEWLTAALGTRHPGHRGHLGRAGPGDQPGRDQRPRSASSAPAACPTGCRPTSASRATSPSTAGPTATPACPRPRSTPTSLGLTGMNTLRCVYADHDTESFDSVVITEDVVVEGAEFLDARSAYTPDQCAQSLEELAGPARRDLDGAAGGGGAVARLPPRALRGEPGQGRDLRPTSRARSAPGCPTRCATSTPSTTRTRCSAGRSRPRSRGA